jgi:hypothetical protein
MTYRNRELLSLGVVGVITGLGFASVYIARQEVISTASLSYGAFFLCLYLAAHVVARLTVPNADPYLLPLVALLTAIGPQRSTGSNPTTRCRRRGSSSAWPRWQPCLPPPATTGGSRAKQLFGVSAVILLRCPSCRSSAARSRRAPVGQIGPVGFQPGELAKVFLIVFLAAYLREKREVLAQARLKDLGPLLLFFGAAMIVLVITSDLGSALLYFGIFLAMLYAATGRTLFVAVGLLLFIAGTAAAYTLIPRVEFRIETWLDPYADPQGASLRGEWQPSAKSFIDNARWRRVSLPKRSSDWVPPPTGRCSCPTATCWRYGVTGLPRERLSTRQFPKTVARRGAR